MNSSFVRTIMRRKGSSIRGAYSEAGAVATSLMAFEFYVRHRAGIKIQSGNALSSRKRMGTDTTELNGEIAKWWCHQSNTEEGRSMMFMTDSLTYCLLVSSVMTLPKGWAAQYRRMLSWPCYNNAHGNGRNYNVGRVSASTGTRPWIPS